jgi:hypothetical protein
MVVPVDADGLEDTVVVEHDVLVIVIHRPWCPSA